MRGQRKYIFNLVSIAPCYVGLPNSSQTVFFLERSVLLGHNFVLQNVLFVTGLTCNLISVVSNTELSTYFSFVGFFKNGCMIQDLTMITVIRVGRLFVGLYYFHSSHKSPTV